MFGTFLFTLTMKQTENLQLRRGEGRGGRQEGDYKKEIKSVEMELEMDCGTVQFPKLWWFLFLHLSGCEQHRRRRRRPLDSPYIINDIISTTLLTKQMHKSQRPKSIDTETFNHVLNNDYCSHNYFQLLIQINGLSGCDQSARRREAAAVTPGLLWLTVAVAAASLCGVAAEKWLSKNAVDICCFVYQPAGAE